VDEFDPLEDAYPNDFPGAFVTRDSTHTKPAVTNQMYDAVIATKYGSAAAARAQAVRGTPVELPVFEDIKSKAPEVQLDEIQPAESSPAEAARQKLLRMRERFNEIPTKNSDGRLDLDDARVLDMADDELVRVPDGRNEVINGAEAKRRYRENQELKRQMQALKEGARIRAAEAAAKAEPTMPIDNFRSRQVLGAVSDTSPEGKAFLVEQLGAVTQEDLLEVKQDISEIKRCLSS
jgi:hypothetical protein